MEHITLWVTIVAAIIFPVVGFLFKVVIEKRLDEIDKVQEKDREVFFRKFDEAKELYVRKDIYTQATEFHQKETDTKFQNLIILMNNQFKAVEEKIEDLKVLIIKNFVKDEEN